MQKMTFNYKGQSLPDELITHLVKAANRLNVPVSYLITKLHFEGLWGGSEVAKANNNWAGMTWTGESLRPSGITVSKGSARPTNEGGHYVRYASVEDFIADWLYLIREGGPYKVANSDSFEEAVKGMFICGGAKYDYATMNVEGSENRYQLYLDRMLSRRQAINQANHNQLDILDERGTDKVATSASKLLSFAASKVGITKYSQGHKAIINKYNATKPLPVGYAVTYDDDWCDAFISYVAIMTDATDIIGRECGVERHKNIFKQKGIWLGLQKPRPGDIVIFQWNGQRNGFAHHIGFVEKVNGNTITTIEGNTVHGGVSKVARNSFSWNDWRIQGYARPKYNGAAANAAIGKKTIKKDAELWETGQKIHDKVKGKSFDVVNVKKVSKGKSRKAYLLHDGTYHIGWLFEEDTVEFKGYKSNREIAEEILDGKWGNNPERASKLNAEGYDALAIQSEVNKLIKEKDSNQPKEEIKAAPTEEQPVGGDEPQLASNEVLLNGTVYQVIKKE